MSSGAVLDQEEVLDALRGVLDPELDRDIVELGFVARVEVSQSEVRVELRLPTYWCAPNFSWLMVSDARRALVERFPGRRISVTLADHHAAEDITAGVNAGRTFEETFGDEAGGELQELRRLFRRRAYLARLGSVLQPAPGVDPVALRIGDLPDTPEVRAYLAVRSELGLDCSAQAPVLVDPEGREVRTADAFLRLARATRVSLEGNTGLCRGLLEARYGKGGTPT